MFGLLKNKLSNFVDGIKKKVAKEEKGEIEKREVEIDKESAKEVEEAEVREERAEKVEEPGVEKEIELEEKVPADKVKSETVEEKEEVWERPGPGETEEAEEIEIEAIEQKEKEPPVEEPIQKETEGPKEEVEVPAVGEIKKDKGPKPPAAKKREEGKEEIEVMPEKVERAKEKKRELIVEEKGQDVEEKVEREKSLGEVGQEKESWSKRISGILPKKKKPAKKEPEKKKVKLSIESTVKSFISGEVEIKEKDVGGLMDELELSLLESDVAYEVALAIVDGMRERLVGKKVKKKELDEEIKGAIREVLIEVLQNESQFDFVNKVKSMEKPVKILFLGPNGAGKTTTIAKVADLLMKNGMTAVFSASDTFRAAAIEQTEEHAKRLGIRAIKSKYGADPASVAFDAVNFAKANNVDAVLIDSAGRQETNRNLIDELRKIKRVVNPDMSIYVGESLGGNAVVDQVKRFNEEIGVDGVILTKLDCDAKGGTAFSISKTADVPILYIGVGQAYSDLKEFNAPEIVDGIIAS